LGKLRPKLGALDLLNEFLPCKSSVTVRCFRALSARVSPFVTYFQEFRTTQTFKKEAELAYEDTFSALHAVQTREALLKETAAILKTRRAALAKGDSLPNDILTRVDDRERRRGGPAERQGPAGQHARPAVCR
jgi:hypothetical protein